MTQAPATCSCDQPVISEENGTRYCAKCGHERPRPSHLSRVEELIHEAISKKVESSVRISLEPATTEALAVSIAQHLIDAVADRVADQVTDRLGTSAAAPTQRSRQLTTAEASKLSGLRPRYLREHFQDLGGYKVGTGPKAHYLFDEEQLQRSRESTEAAAPARKRHRLPPGVELLQPEPEEAA